MEPLSADDPQQVGVYRLHARLGAGGMGRVYLGRSPGGRAVAVKIVHADLARDPEFVARFRREVQAAEAVSGAYTAPVVGAGPDDNPPWLATAFVAGPSLAELIDRAGPLPEAAACRLAGGLIEALQAIHDRGLVHRDLKPANILIAVDGPRVIDFGISRALQGTALTAARTTLGTPVYMSPEQAEGRAIGAPSDVFSLGSVLSFAATGRAPFDGGDLFAIAYRIVHDEPDLSRLPPALRDLVASCLAKDPARRPSLDRLMDAVLAGSAPFPAIAPGRFWPDPVAGLVPGQTSRVTAMIPPTDPMQGAAQGGGQAAAATHAAQPAYPAVTTAPQWPLAPQGPRAPRPRRGGRRWVLAGVGAGVVAVVLGATLALVLGSKPTTSTPGQAVSTHHAGVASTPAAASVSSAPPTTAPPTSPSPSASLIAVTVCTFPADGCNVAGASQFMEITPKQITDSGDGSGYVTDLIWSNWGASQATATGTQEIDNCNPNCAQGTDSPFPATVTVAGLTPYGTDLDAYSTIVIQVPAAGQTYTYTQDTVP
jgi:eukaryotic-like serine/threonine-protein kinase